MRYLLDTNVLSEGARPEPDPGVARFLDEASSLDLAIGVLTVGEIRQGIAALDAGARKRRLEQCYERELIENPAIRERIADYHDLVESGSREIYRPED